MDPHTLRQIVVVKDAPGATTVVGHCACGWSHQSTGWTVQSTTKNGIKPAHARHLRKLEGASTASDSAIDSVPMAIGGIAILVVVAVVIVILIGISKALLGGDGGSPDEPDDFAPVSGPCPGLVEFLHENDSDTAVWKAVNERFNRECAGYVG